MKQEFNLHGPEIIGTPLVGLLITHLQLQKQMNGSITLVPCANPMGVNDSTLALDGRWNKKSGLNWNRIHHVDKQWHSVIEKKHFYQALLKSHNLSLETRLSATLHLIAGQPDYVIDLHAAGLYSCDYRFELANAGHDFDGLNNQLSVIVDIDERQGNFISSFVRPFSHHPELMSKGCTWELAGDQQVCQHTLAARWQALRHWVNTVFEIPDESTAPPLPQQDTVRARLIDFEVIHSQTHGYFIWKKEVGDIVAANEVYITYYDPSCNTFTDFSEARDFILVSKYTIGAVGEGEQIGERVWLTA